MVITKYCNMYNHNVCYKGWFYHDGKKYKAILTSYNDFWTGFTYDVCIWKFHKGRYEFCRREFELKPNIKYAVEYTIEKFIERGYLNKVIY